MSDADNPPDRLDEATQAFLDHRELIFSIVYDMLGLLQDTEDVLQEVWLSWQARCQSPAEPVLNARAYLVRMAVNQAMARQVSIRRRREAYVGPWLPEPLLTEQVEHLPGGEADASAEVVERTEAVSIALLVVLETLTPLERAVFVLHDVFGFQHTEIAVILDRSPSAIRQLAHRAHEHVQARRPRFRIEPRVRREATERFLAAAIGGDLPGLMEILAPNVTVWTDGGGRIRRTIPRPIHGREKASKFICAVASKDLAGVEIRYRQVNGDPTAVIYSEGSPLAVMVLDLAPGGGQVTAVYTVTNPEKLTGVIKDVVGEAMTTSEREQGVRTENSEDMR
ncbi:RNA polymerase sigma-70 factor [Catenulispora yoronensis]|uniref:RNA polymerase sigma-70 factor n=1 Tax=Catenulispora yoronensis TaxID=450799 RepID=A0ABN2UUF8_9ACTN